MSGITISLVSQGTKSWGLPWPQLSTSLCRQQCIGTSVPSLHAQGLEEVCTPGKSSGREPTGL